jgi:hypothetical protein
MSSPQPTSVPVPQTYGYANSTALATPANSANNWLYATIANVPTPGTIPRGGVKGFRRVTAYDKKMGKGTEGATLTATGLPPCKGSITLQLFQYDDFGAWDSFVSNVLAVRIPLNSSGQPLFGLPISHPSFAAIALTRIVVESYSALEYLGKGLYHATIELCEWQQPPATSVVKTVQKTAPSLAPPSAAQPRPAQARLAQVQAENAQRAAQLALAQGGTNTTPTPGS